MSFLGYIVCFVICRVIVLASDGIRIIEETDQLDKNNKGGDEHQVKTDDGFIPNSKTLAKSEGIDPAIYDEDSIREDSILDTLQLMWKYGYPGEIHDVPTEDGYILTTHRLARPGAVPLFLMHGLFDSSATWVMLGPYNGLGYLFYEQGYDVWMGNARGNTYGERHKYLKTESKQFWDFSFHEIAIYDLTSNIDYILNKTGYSQLHYIGHSQGTTTFFIMCSQRPEYMSKIRLMQALAPVISFKYTRSAFIIFIGKFARTKTDFYNRFGAMDSLSRDKSLEVFSRIACYGLPYAAEICRNIAFTLTGFNDEQFNETTQPIVTGHVPAGVAVKQLVHFAQVRKFGELRQFDYGTKENLLIYNSTIPPIYDLKKVTVKIGMYYGQNDFLAMPGDAQIARDSFPNVFEFYELPLKKFNHIDFLWAIDGRVLLWNRLIRNMKQYDCKDKGTC